MQGARGREDGSDGGARERRLASTASEIVAGALQDHQRATIVGVQTFGKGSVQTILPLPNNRAVKLTTARYYTAGPLIQAKGIAADIVVEDRGHEGPLREADLQHHLSVEDDKSSPARPTAEARRPTGSSPVRPRASRRRLRRSPPASRSTRRTTRRPPTRTPKKDDVQLAAALAPEGPARLNTAAVAK